MYTKDKATRITLRLSEEQFNFIHSNAELIGVSPSEFLRMMVNAAIGTTKRMEEKLKEGSGRENDKANFDNQL